MSYTLSSPPAATPRGAIEYALDKYGQWNRTTEGMPYTDATAEIMADMKIIGTSIILRRDNLCIFEIQKPSKWETDETGAPSIGMGCIGGRMEDRETPRETLEREAREEIGCGLRLKQPAHRFLYDRNGDVRMLDAGQLPENAFFLWEGNDPGFVPGLAVVVYTGEPTSDPEPNDLPAIIMLTPDLAFACGNENLTVAEAIGRGAQLRERHPVPRQARLRPVGTVGVLIELKKKVPELLAEILQ